MMYGSQDIKMEKIENQIFFVDQGTSSGLKLTLIINHLKVKKKKKRKKKKKILYAHKTCCEIVCNVKLAVTLYIVSITNQT